EGYERRLGLSSLRLDEGAIEALSEAAWPGNVRELDHLLGRAVLRASAGVARDTLVVIEKTHLQLEESPPKAASILASEGSKKLPEASSKGRSLRAIVEETKRRAIREAVAANDGNWAAAARTLGMARGNLHHMARRLGLRE